MNPIKKACIVSVVCLLTAIKVVGTEATNATEKVLQHPTFPEGLTWIGSQAPSEAESSELLEVVTNLDQPWWRDGVEQFLTDHPLSPWAASLRYDYASFCRETGRTTKALEQFGAAWALVKNDTSPQGERLGGTILANWTDLLSSLGRLEELKKLVAAGDDYHFVDPQDRNKFEGAKNSYYLMQSHPGIAYRCGTFALKAVGESLQPTNRALEELVSIPSPTNGFSMAGLSDIAKQYGLNLVAVRRTQGREILVPSVVHWRQNHYAAILKQQGDSYLVSDPTFEWSKWMPSEVINEEASGEFLIPAQSQTANWTQLARKETETIRGMGLKNSIKDGKDKNCKRGFDGNTVCKHCPPKGMPIWWVSEPYINLWIADQPISYLTSRGEPMTFEITYKQRDTRIAPASAPLTGWNHSWFSYIRVVSEITCSFNCFQLNFQASDSTVFLPNGGEVDFAAGQAYDQEAQLLLQTVNGNNTLTGGVIFPTVDNGNNGLRLVHADGSQDIYGFGVAEGTGSGGYPVLDFFLTRHIDPHGNTTCFFTQHQIAPMC